MKLVKKKMSIRYLPARVVEGKYRWYIVFYQTNPLTGKYERHRDNPSVNRVKDIEERRKLCDNRCEHINDLLPYGYPFEREYASLPKYQYLVDVLVNIKPLLKNKYPDDFGVLSSSINLLKEYLNNKALVDLRANQFSKKKAVNFFFYLADEGKKDREISLHLLHLKKVFAELKRGNYIKKNPIKKIKKTEILGLKNRTNIIVSLEVARKLKYQYMKKRSKQTVNSMINVFTEFLENSNYTKMQIGKFTRSEAMEFSRYAILEREVGPRTHNNYLASIRALFTELLNAGYIKQNHFSSLPRKKEKAKNRRAFTHEERDNVSRLLENDDPYLYLGVLLQYHCFIRPIEQRRLRFRDIDLKLGIIRLSGDQTKNSENDIVTIPDGVIPKLLSYNLHKYNQNWLIFGERGAPHPTVSAGHQLMYLRHKKLLQKYLKNGVISNMEGLTYYSWKDTGAMELFRLKVNPLEIMKQLRHKNLKTTLVYCQSLYYINEEIKALKNNIQGMKEVAA